MPALLRNSKSKRIIELYDLGFDMEQIAEQLIKEGWAPTPSELNPRKSRADTGDPSRRLYYIREIIARKRGKERFNMRLTALEREVAFMRAIFTEFAKAHPKDLQAISKRVQGRLAQNGYYPASAMASTAPQR